MVLYKYNSADNHLDQRWIPANLWQDRVARKFSPEEAEMLKEMGQLVEAELISLTQTTIDELTRITNRRGFMAIAAHVLAICTRAEKSVALLMFDLDGFKEINDQFGHQAGDKALIDFAKMLLKISNDIFDIEVVLFAVMQNGINHFRASDLH